MLKKLSGLIIEKDKVSLGRVSFWIFTFAILYYWLSFDKDIPPNIMIIYTTLVAYNLFKKPLNLVEMYIGNKK